MKIQTFSNLTSRLLLMLGLGALWMPLQAQVQPQLGFCRLCAGDAAFADAAELAAPDWAPMDGTPVLYPVYVIDPASGEIRYFDVVVWRDWGGAQPQGGEPRDSEAADRIDNTLQFSWIQKEAYPGHGDLEILDAIGLAHVGVSEFLSPINLEFPASDIPHAPGSAIDVIGPSASSAGYALLNLEAGVADMLEDRWASIVFGWADIARRAADRMFGSSDYLAPATTVRINFPDGTRIDLDIESISPTLSGRSRVRVRVRPESARLPDGRTVPQDAGHFDGFAYFGETALIDVISDLAFRYGIPVSGDGDRIGCSRFDNGPLTCWRLH